MMDGENVQDDRNVQDNFVIIITFGTQRTDWTETEQDKGLN